VTMTGFLPPRRMYIDVNKDDDFADAGETISLPLSGSGLTKTFDYDVCEPLQTAPTASTLMWQILRQENTTAP
jgi:hypothetical protein